MDTPHLYYDVHGITNAPFVLASDYDALLRQYMNGQGAMAALRKECDTAYETCEAFRQALVRTVEKCRKSDAELLEVVNVFAEENSLHSAPELCPTYYDGCNCGGVSGVRELFKQRDQAREERNKALAERDMLKTANDVTRHGYESLLNEHNAEKARADKLQAEREKLMAMQGVTISREYRPPIETVCPYCHAKTIGPCMNIGCQPRSDPTW